MVDSINIEDGETVHQRCLLISGYNNVRQFPTACVTVQTLDTHGRRIFPTQQWPFCDGYFKLLVFLQPGPNVLKLSFPGIPGESYYDQYTIHYVPLLQTPPLHLALLVAKDSPLQIDCPPEKHAALSSAHSSINAAIAKFRMTAYMWQAMIAEDLRSKNLGRRSFRIDEDWGFDSLTKASTDAALDGNREAALTSTATVHLIRTNHTVAELRKAEHAYYSPERRSTSELHSIFVKALENYGGPLTPNARPVVAGLVLDSHYSPTQKSILGQIGSAECNPSGISLGMFGSELTYSWPRHIEEVSDCLLDKTTLGRSISDDGPECRTMWKACAIGQGAFLRSAARALGVPQKGGITRQAYAPDWPKCFLAETALDVETMASGVYPVTPETPNACNWDVRDALHLAGTQHFWQPSDAKFDGITARDPPLVVLVDDEEEDFARVSITSQSGIAGVYLNGEPESEASIISPAKSLQLTVDELETRFERSAPLELEALGLNGRHTKMNLWQLFTSRSSVRVPGTNIRLEKQSVGSERGDCVNDSPIITPGNDTSWRWTVMLKKKNPRTGALVSASKIDLRVGCALDGAVVHYRDGTQTPCGPLGKPMGGHQARKMALPRGAEIARVQVASQSGTWYSGVLLGLRMHLANGRAMGALNGQSGDAVTTLVPRDGHKIVGFFGTSGARSMCYEFGIVTAPRDAVLPDSVYDLPELQNTDGKMGYCRGAPRKGQMGADDEGQGDEDETDTEDEDGGYDRDNYDEDTDMADD